jgi:DNA ligase (NAD+)
VKGIGPVALSSLLAYSKEEVLVKAAKDLAKALKIHDETASQANDLNIEDSPFKDMIIVFTGTLPISRTAAQNVVKAKGAKSTPNSVSKSTDLVVTGDKGGKKVNQAKELGIQVMEADEFMKLIS